MTKRHTLSTFFHQVVSIVLYNLMTNRLVNSDLKDRLRGAAHLGRAGGLQYNRFFFHHYDGGFVLESLIFISQANASSWRARLTRNQNTSDQVFPTTKDHCNANMPVMMLVNLLGYVKHAPVVKFS